MTKLIDEHLLIHGVEPRLDLGEGLEVGFLWQMPLVGRKRKFDGELSGQREIDRKDRTSFVPLLLAQRIGTRRRRVGKIERGHLGHGCVTQSQGPCANLTATALRPSWYCTAMTVASAARPLRSRSSRTRSSNSNGNVERKIAKSGAANSSVAASRSLVRPPRRAVTCTGIRTAAACGKNRASCSAQPCSWSGAAISAELFTSPLNLQMPSATVTCDRHTRHR